MKNSRRDVLKAALSGAALLPAAVSAAVPTTLRPPRVDAPHGHWGRGLDDQRKADRGDGTFLNPVLAGDYPDPSILKDGDDYYMTHSSFDASPGLIIWHSRDLVNWEPVGPALAAPLGTVFAVDLVKHEGRFYIYIPFMAAPWSKGLKSFANIYVIHAESMSGPWSEPIDLGIGGLIDPGHVVGEDGRRYLFLSGVQRVRLSLDGLSTDGPIELNCSPLTQLVGDHAYEISVQIEVIGEAQGGLLLFFNDRLFFGMGHDGAKMTTYRGGKPSYWREPAPVLRVLHLKIVNDRHIVTFYYSEDGIEWTRHGVRSETSGCNANTLDDLASFRPALFAAGNGAVRFRNFRYRALA